ncbi:hypothetical protein WJX84_001249 [Apatococcus fuscideae]|uniref:Macrophage erythroblast attacher n=1 Tax=Apatococcus fuscideae TaxID=2026836 RepID=A0AAW1TGZ5_9CHLO
MTGTESLDSPLIRVPFEALRRTTRERKYILEEIESLLKRVQPGQSGTSSIAEQVGTLNTLVEQLQSLKCKLDAVTEQELDNLHRCRSRLVHVQNLGHPQKDAALDHCRQRLPQMLVDHLLRSGQYQTAHQLASQAGILDLVDVHLFAGAQAIVQALEQHDCKPALAWCELHQPRLRKLKSKLEFRLCLQEFIELVRSGSLPEAIAYARAHLAQWAGSYLPELQQALCTLAFRASTTCKPYQQLFADAQWLLLVEAFLSELYRLNSLPAESTLSIHIQAGLSALKPAVKVEGITSIEDPLHSQAYQQLAEGLACSKQIHSKLICPVTRELMNEHNPPVVLPNGAVYSERAVQDLANREGQFSCPSTGFVCNVKDVQRAYVS